MSEHDDQSRSLPETIDDVVDLLLYRLGDSEQRVWSASVLERFYIRGMNELAKECRIIWDSIHFEDEIDRAVHPLPTPLIQVERCTWDDKRMSPIGATDLQRFDYAYRTTKGDVYAYIQDTDGLRSFRKIRVPAGDYVPYDVSFEGDKGRGLAWGIARTLAPLEGYPLTVVAGSLPRDSTDYAWGIPRRIAYQHPTGGANWGIPRRFEKPYRNVKVEHWRRPLDPRRQSSGWIELPAPYLKYVLWYALWQALEMDGPGQDPEMAVHYQARWLGAIERAKQRQLRVDRYAFHRMGGGDQPIPRPPRPQLPWQFGEPVD